MAGPVDGPLPWIHRVDRLDEQGYEEAPVRRVGTSWHPGLIGTHTIQRAGGFDAIDAASGCGAGGSSRAD